MYIVKKISLYTGKIIEKKVFDSLDKAIAYHNSNLSVSGSYRVTFSSNKFIK
jgi:hypothetical protein